MPRSSEFSRYHGLRQAVPAFLILLSGLAASTAAAAPGHSSRPSEADAYLLSMGRSTMSSNIDMDEHALLLEKLPGDFLWFRRGAEVSLIQDRATLEEARALFTPLRALEPEQEDLRRREEALDEKEQELDRQEERIDRLMDLGSGDEEGDDNDEGDDASEEVSPISDADRQAIESELSELRARQRELQVQSRELEQVDRALDAREDAIERDAEAKLWSLIDAAVKKGLAKPGPRS